jgi:hypothetical protein
MILEAELASRSVVCRQRPGGLLKYYPLTA